MGKMQVSGGSPVEGKATEATYGENAMKWISIGEWMDIFGERRDVEVIHSANFSQGERTPSGTS